jgi:hypothetical protein
MLHQESLEHWGSEMTHVADVGNNGTYYDTDGMEVGDVFAKWPFDWSRTDKSTSALIREFQRLYGASSWAQVEDELLSWVNGKLGCPEHQPAVGYRQGAVMGTSTSAAAAQHQTVWEDVRGEGNSDGAWFTWKEGPRRGGASEM